MRNSLPEPEKIPLEYLADPTLCSLNIIGEYQLRRLNRAANIKREILKLIEAYLEEMTAAGLAVFLREHRQQMVDIFSTVGQEER